MSTEETKIIYYFDEETTPYLVKLPIDPEKVTLAGLLNLFIYFSTANAYNYRFQKCPQSSEF